MKRAAIVGCGYIAGKADIISKRPQIFTHAKAIQNIDGLELVACCDSDNEVLSEFVLTWDVPRKYTNLEEMLAKEKIDIFIIASPTEFHHEHVLMGLKYDVGAIFCEKPVSDDFIKALELQRIAKNEKKIIAINFMRRWDDFYINCKKILESGSLGRVETIVAYVDTALYMNSIHMIDMLVYFGGDITFCVGQLDRINTPRTVHGQIDYGGYSFIKHSQGAISFIKASGESRANNYFEIDIQCTQGRLRMLNDGEKYELYKFKQNKDKKWLSNLVLDKVVNNDLKNERLVSAYEDIISCIDSGSETQSSIQNALKSMEVIEMIYKSDKLYNKPFYSSAGDSNE